MIVVLTYSAEDCQKAVKMESSYIAERADEGQFDKIVFDEEYETLFADLFLDARSRVMSSLVRYVIDTSFITAADYLEDANYDMETNFALFLNIPDSWTSAMSLSLFSEIKSFIVSYIMYRWLESKDPSKASVFMQRADSHEINFKRIAEYRVKRRHIRPCEPFI